MALTVTIPGAVSTTTGSTAPAVLTVGVGSPGAQGATGATGATGPGVAAGGSAGQVLAKIDGTNYNTEWVNVEGDYLPLAGGAMDTDAEVTIAETTGHDSELAGWGLGVELSADHAQGTTVEYNGLNVYNGTDTINVNPTGINLTNNDTTKHTNITTSYINVTDDNNGYNVQLIDGTIILTNGGTDSVLSINSNTGITFDDTTVQNTAFPGFAGYATLASPVFTGDARAPTPATSDNDTSIATTAFVKAQGYVTSSTAPVTSVAGRTGAVTLAVADVSGAAPLASPSLTGTPLSTTASVSTNTTQIATTAFVLGQVGTATPIVNGTAAVGTSLLYARQDHVHGTDTTRAALESPTFSGTPTLPTGTIATTQSPGNNTTALATTAFVTAAVPAFATDAEAIANTSATTVISPANYRFAGLTTNIWAPNVINLSSLAAGTGSNVGSAYTALNGRLLAPNASTAGYATRGFMLYFPSNTAFAGYNFSTQSGHAVRVYSVSWGSTVAGVKMRGVFGRMGAAIPTPATLAVYGYGWEWDFSTRTMKIIAHNGTTLTTTSVTWNPAAYNTYEITVTSNGAGTISLYVDGTLLGTSSGGPVATSVSTGPIWWQLEIENLVTAGSQVDCYYQNPKVITTNG